MNKSALLLFVLISATAPAGATPLVYTPVNPSFGGNPLNGSVLLNEANAINDYKAPTNEKTPADRLEQFSESLQNAILSRVTSAAIRNIVSVDGGLLPGTVETQDFIITVTQLGSGVTQITTTDKTTGQTSTFEIGTTPP